jgi:segregation and condensation protein A
MHSAGEHEVCGGHSCEGPNAFIVDIDGYEGPVDVLLGLAREQKVDLKHVSIVQLAEQYLTFIAEARRGSLEVHAEYLVMAAWLAYLKSRLLLPELPRPDEPSGEEMAAALGFQLRRLEAMRDAGAGLMARNRLDQDIFPRGEVERFAEVTTIGVMRVDLHDLLRAYAAHVARQQPHGLHIETSDLCSVKQALDRLRQMLGTSTGWAPLFSFLSDETAEGLREGRIPARSALAATFAASLELVREGHVRLRQNSSFGPIYLGRSDCEKKQQ